MTIETGAKLLAGDPGRAGSGRFGLVTNFTGVMPDLSRNVDAFLSAGLNVTALFGPEHGLRGSAQAGETAGEAGSHAFDPATGLPLFETYAASDDELDELVAQSGVDALLFDMQDVGVRYYTYVWTMYDCMRSAARAGIRFIVLDRPNPLGGAVVSGPGPEAAFASFVGRTDIRLRHGLTVGELARLFNAHVLPQDEGPSAELDVIAMQGWARNDTFDATGLHWVAPSPNMPTLETAFAYCGTGLFEGTNVSEGRGTTKPFEVVGAPYVTGALIDAMRELELPGALFRDAWYVPTFHKYAGQSIRGVQLHVTDREAFDPVGGGVAMLATFAGLYPDDFRFLAPNDPVDSAGDGFAIDRLWGSDSLRTTIQSGGDALGLLDKMLTVEHAYPNDVVLYPSDL